MIHLLCQADMSGNPASRELTIGIGNSDRYEWLLESPGMGAILGARRYGLLLKVLSLALILQVAGCSGARNEQISRQTALGTDVAPGVVLIDVLEAGRPEHYWQYEVQPTAGLVREVEEENFQDYAHEDIPRDFQQPSGAIEACAKNPEAGSLDGNYLARCANSGADEFFVVDEKTTETLYHWKPNKRRGIRGFAWAPNSRSVAVLNVSSYYGKTPLELLSGLSGHPVPHDTVLLDVLDVRSSTMTEYTVRRNVVSSFTRILKWPESK